MRLNATFRCSLPFDKSAHPVGKELAEYLRTQFTNAGVTISNLDSYEDYAWALDTTISNKPLFLLVGYIGDEDDEWLLQINKYTRSFWDFFRRNVALAEREQLASRVHDVLASDPTFSLLRWHAGDFTEGIPSTTPLSNT